MSSSPKDSLLFAPLAIAGGKITLKHRVVHAPCTRNRAIPLNEELTPENPNRIWYPDELVAEYYAQRATEGGLLISEGIPPSLEATGAPGVPGLFHPSHLTGWRLTTAAVHRRGGFIYAQLWHAGRTTLPHLTGTPSVSASAAPWDDPSEQKTIHRLPPLSDETVLLVDYPPLELTKEGIKKTISDYCNAARMAMDAGFDGVEVHGGNGYLPEQFLSSNINVRSDEYGGSPEKRCRFVVELMEALAETVGEENVAIRLSPFGLFNQARGTERVETWGHLCRELKRCVPGMSYVSFIEPRYEQIFSVSEKDSFLSSWGLEKTDLSYFREIMGSTPFFSAGGWNDKNSWGVLESGACDALLYGRYFLSNPDLVERLKHGWPLERYDRATFYGPFEDRTFHYTDYKPWQPENVANIEGVKLEGVKQSKLVDVTMEAREVEAVA
ncbi:oxidoreductase [Lophium mytilinum]|uniref:Oxidoreductase n=1 Tax=Lophium mytilinum TaxID=390894 RepID=A0A6A6QUJ6_9PEZI|nr:oxidoreductase [Lophium mytilinum]